MRKVKITGRYFLYIKVWTSGYKYNRMNLQNQTSELKTLYIEGMDGYLSAKSVIYARLKEGGN